MKKCALIFYKVISLMLVIMALIFSVLTFSNMDSLVTEHITLKYFETSMNNYNPINLKEFVADSENDILYKNAKKNYELYYNINTEGYNFKIDEYEIFGNGKYQCYFNYYRTPTCDVNYEGDYMNYLIETTTTYKTKSGEVQTVKEKGLVVFVKDGSNGNLFEWKLVRYDRESNI